MKYAPKNAGNSEMFPDVGYETNKEKNLLYLENELKFTFCSEIGIMKARNAGNSEMLPEMGCETSKENLWYSKSCQNLQFRLGLERCKLKKWAAHQTWRIFWYSKMRRNLQSTNAAKEYWKCKQEVKISKKSIYQELWSELFEERQINPITDMICFN